MKDRGATGGISRKMQELKQIRRFDQAVMDEIVRRIVQQVDPERIVLFGSYARGNPHRESDVDLLVVMETDLPRHKRSVPIYRALAGLLLPKDVLVYTPEEIRAWQEVPQAFITTALREGRVLYEKKQSRPGSGMAGESPA